MGVLKMSTALKTILGNALISLTDERRTLESGLSEITRQIAQIEEGIARLNSQGAPIAPEPSTPPCAAFNLVQDGSKELPWSYKLLDVDGKMIAFSIKGYRTPTGARLAAIMAKKKINYNAR
jgi:hypothetical protein